MRNRFVQLLVEWAQADESIYLLTADLGFSVLEPFAEAFARVVLNYPATPYTFQHTQKDGQPIRPEDTPNTHRHLTEPKTNPLLPENPKRTG